MNPLCTLRYSATHADKHHMVYRLDAVDAYEQQAGQADRGSLGDGRRRPQQTVRAAGFRRATGEGTITAPSRARRTDRRRRPAPGDVTVQDGDDLEQTTEARYLRELPRRRDSRRPRATSTWNFACQAASSTYSLGETWGDVDALADPARDDPPHDPRTPRQGEAPAPAGHQGAVAVLHRRGREVPAVRRRRQRRKG